MRSCEKKAHLSIDDVSHCLQRLSSEKNESIFDVFFLKYLLILHRLFNAKFTCYLYTKDNKWDINKFPQRYKDELRSVSHWLKFNIHAITPDDKHVIDEEAFGDAITTIKKVLPIESISKIVRLHYWFYPSEYVNTLKENGVTTILTRNDDDNVSVGSLNEWKTQIQIEKTENILKKVFLNEKIPLVVFTHEWALNRKNKIKLIFVLLILKVLGYQFICE